MYTEEFKMIVWRQFGAAIDMLGDAIRECPEEIWGENIGPQEFWYIAYHNLYWLDFYLSEGGEGFAPPPPFGLEEMDPAGLYPPRVHSKEELLAYLQHCRTKCRLAIEDLSDETADIKYTFFSRTLPRIEVFLYTMRHVQHHAAQLNLLLRQRANFSPKWLGAPKDWKK